MFFLTIELIRITRGVCLSFSFQDIVNKVCRCKNWASPPALAALSVVKASGSQLWVFYSLHSTIIAQLSSALWRFPPLSVSPSGSLALRWWILLVSHFVFFYPTPHTFFEVWFAAALSSSGGSWGCSGALVWAGCVTSIISVLFRPLIHCRAAVDLTGLCLSHASVTPTLHPSSLAPSQQGTACSCVQEIFLLGEDIKCSAAQSGWEISFISMVG